MLFVSVLLAAAPLVSVAPSADEGLPCPVHRNFISALAARRVVAPEAFTAVFERRERGWAFRLLRGSTANALTRALDVSCEEAGAVAALVVERYFGALFLAAAKVVAAPRPTAAPRPSPPPETPLAVVPVPVPVEEPDPIDAGPPEPLDAGSPLMLEITPDAGLPTAPVVAAAPPPREPFLHVVPAVWVLGWWEVLPRISPAVMVAVQLELGRVWRTELALASGLPLAQDVTVDADRRGQLIAWSNLGTASGGACARLERFTLCGDAVIGLRLSSGQTSGQLYQRQPRLLLMPTAGLRGELVLRLTALLSLSATLSGLVPFGRSTLRVEGTGSIYATPPVDVLGGVGLRLTL